MRRNGQATNAPILTQDYTLQGYAAACRTTIREGMASNGLPGLNWGMALNEDQVVTLWEHLINAEMYALYFGELTNRYSRKRQSVTFLSFFFSSGAAVSALSKAPWEYASACAIIVAIATAYSVATGLDGKIRTMSKLHWSWMLLSQDYDELWERTWSETAEADLHVLVRREPELSQLATTDAPNNRKILEKSQNQVFALRHIFA